MNSGNCKTHARQVWGIKGQQLRAHVRFEEDELFPAIERIASAELTDVHLERDQ